MDVGELVRKLREIGARVTVENDSLRVEAPAGAVDARLRAAIGERKPELLALLRSSDAAARNGVAADPSRTRGALSFAQERVWMFQALEPTSSAYNLTPVLRVRGPLDLPRFKEALELVVRRHTPLRTLVQIDQGPVQVLLPDDQVDLRFHDLSALDPTEQEASFQALVREQQGTPFALHLDPPFRVAVVQRAIDVHDIAVTFHHLAVDGLSLSIFVRDLVRAYDDRQLPPLPFSYLDFAEWQRKRWTDEALEADYEYWREHLSGAPQALDLPVDGPRGAVASYDGAALKGGLDVAATARLKSVAREEGCSLFMALLSIFAATLHRHSGQRDMILGTPVSGRERSEASGMVGMFVNQLPLRARVRNEASFRSSLRESRLTTLGALAHQHVPFSGLVNRLALSRTMSTTPLFQAVLNVVPAIGDTADWVGESFTIVLPDADELLALFDGQSKFDLTLYGTERADALQFVLVYNRRLFSEVRMTQLLLDIEELARRAAEAPDEPLDRVLPVAAVRPWPLGNDGTGSISERFESVARERPSDPAVLSDHGEITYGDLLKTSNDVATRVAAASPDPERPVGVFVGHDSAMVEGVFGVLRSGRPYVPLDATYPEARLRMMVEDAGVEVVVTTPALEARARELLNDGARVLLLDGSQLSDGAEVPSMPDPEQLAYLLYTSGSTGRPKAVMQSHRNVVRQADRYAQVMELGPGDRLALTASVSFDACVMDLFGALLNGAAIAPVDLRAIDLAQVPEIVEQRALNVLHVTPTVFRTMLRVAPEAGFSTVRAVDLGGEGVRSDDVTLFDRAFPPNAILVNSYGPSEHTFALGYRVPRGHQQQGREVPIGWPLDDVEVALMDEDGCEDPVRGEMVLRSAFGALGYWGRPDLTRATFVRDPEREGYTSYRTGDVVRRRPDGAYVYLHRADDQMKVRGHRIEPGEVESVLTSNPGVAEAAVHAPEGVDGLRDLVGCVVPADPGEPPTFAALSAWCRERLPSYMVPSRWVALDVLPRTPTGKIDRRVLPDGGAADAGQDRLLPRDALEQSLAEIWSEALGRGITDIRSDFFEIGGHSLTATRVVARVRDVLGMDLPLRRFFDYPTIEESADWLRERKTAGEVLPPLRPVTGDAPLSPAQDRVWLFQEMDPDTSTYNVPLMIHLTGAVDVERLEGALRVLVERHHPLRTRLVRHDRRLVQRLDPVPETVLLVDDLRAEPEADREALVAAKLRGERERPFRLANEIPFRALLLRHAEDRWDLAITLHHTAADGTSVQILVGELLDAYEGRPLRPLTSSYADYAAWSRDMWAGERLEQEVGYWRAELEGAPQVLELPTDRPRAPMQTFSGGLITRFVPPSEGERLGSLLVEERSTLFMALAAALGASLHRHSGQRDLVLGTPVSGRMRAEVLDLVGMFVNQLPLRVRVGPGASFRDLLKGTRQTALDAFAHQDLPFSLLLEALDPPRDLSRTPIFQAMVNVLPPVTERLEAEGSGVRFALPDADEVRALFDVQSKFDLTLYARAEGKGFHVGLVYNRDLFEESRIQSVLDVLLTVLLQGSKAPDTDLAEFAVRDVHEVSTRGARPTGRVTEYDSEPWAHETITARFQDVAGRYPDAPALLLDDGSVSYAALMERADDVARRVVATASEGPVGVLLGHEDALPAAILGVLRAGRAYVPLDASYPPARLQLMVDDAGVGAVVTSTEHAPRAEELLGDRGRVIVLDGPSPLGTPELPEAPQGEDVAYLLYTSGSTGRPKAVTQTHRNVVRQAGRYAGALALGPGARVALTASVSFDACVMDLFGALLSGAALSLVDVRAVGVARLPEVLERRSLTVLHVTPTVFRSLARVARGARFPTVRTVVLGGEPVSSEDVAYFDASFGPDAWMLNLYGAAEHSFALGSRIDRASHLRTTEVPIGWPIDDVEAILLDENGDPDPVKGQLAVRSEFGALGYWGLGEQTREKFLVHPERPRTRTYLSGDVLRRRPDGAFVFVHRADHQMKVRGHRIEPGEIEAALVARGGVQEAVVVTRDDRLIAYIVPGATRATVAELRSALSDVLPQYMMPSFFIELEALPLTPTGKIDRKALPEPGSGVPEPQEVLDPATPAQQLMASVWSELLSVEAVGVRDNFFELGGHSLLAMEVVALIEERTGHRMDPRTLFFKSLGELANALDMAG